MMPTARRSLFERKGAQGVTERDNEDQVTRSLLAQLDCQQFGYSTDFIKLFEDLGAALDPGDVER